MSFYAESKYKNTATVWNRFNNDEGQYLVAGSSNYSDERDAKQTKINTIHNADQNIEDRYSGETDNTYDQDSKYYSGTSFGPSSLNSSTMNSDSLLYIVSGLFIWKLFLSK